MKEATEKASDSWFGLCKQCGKQVPRLKNKDGQLSELCQDCGLRDIFKQSCLGGRIVFKESEA